MSYVVDAGAVGNGGYAAVEMRCLSHLWRCGIGWSRPPPPLTTFRSRWRAAAAVCAVLCVVLAAAASAP